MRTETRPLYAIFRNKKHICNGRGYNELDAIKQHLIDADLGEFIDDKELLKLFTAEKAKINIHFHYSQVQYETFGQKYIDLIKLNKL